MFNNDNVKPTKLSSLFPTIGYSSNNSLSYLTTRMQTLKTEIVVVDSIHSEEDVIFTTVSGEKISAKTNFPLNVGDQIRVEEKENGLFEVVSIYKKTEILDPAKFGKESPDYSIYDEAYSTKNSSPSNRYISGMLIALEMESSRSRLKNEKKLLIPGVRYEFEVISSSSDKDEVDHSLSKKNYGVVDVLSEILSDNTNMENAIGAKVVDYNARGTLLSTELGALQIEEPLSLLVGTDIVIRVVNKNPGRTEDIFDREKLSNAMIALEHILNKSNKDNFLDAINLVKILSIYCEIRRRKEDPSIEKFLENLNINFVESEFEELYRDYLCVQEFIGEESGKIIGKTPIDMWLYFFIHVNYDKRNTKQKIFFKKEKEKIRVVTDLSLSELGKMQVEICFFYDLDSKGNFYKINNIITYIRSANEFANDFLEFVSSKYRNLFKKISINKELLFEKSDKFLVLEEDFIENKNLNMAENIGFSNIF